MRALDRLIPTPRLLEIADIEIAAPVSKVWNAIRHTDLARSLVIQALFLVRSLPSRLAGRVVDAAGIRIDDMVSTPEHPGFQVLSEDPPHEVAVGAIGKVWHAEIPFVHVADEREFASFDLPDFVKVAWALRLDALPNELTRLSVELRVAASDEDTWVKFRRYFFVIGPASRFIRHSALKALAKDLGQSAQAGEGNFARGRCAA